MAKKNKKAKINVLLEAMLRLGVPTAEHWARFSCEINRGCVFIVVVNRLIGRANNEAMNCSPHLRLIVSVNREYNTWRDSLAFSASTRTQLEHIIDWYCFIRISLLLSHTNSTSISLKIIDWNRFKFDSSSLIPIYIMIEMVFSPSV